MLGHVIDDRQDHHDGERQCRDDRQPPQGADHGRDDEPDRSEYLERSEQQGESTRQPRDPGHSLSRAVVVGGLVEAGSQEGQGKEHLNHP